MVGIFLQVLPFFALIVLGWGACRVRIFPPEATGHLTKFIFFFPLSAMLFKFTSELDLAQVFHWRFVLAYFVGSLSVWALGFAVARLRGEGVASSAIEAQTGMVGNTGFLGVPMLAAILGAQAVAPILMVLCVDLIGFSVLFTLVINVARHGRAQISVMALGLLKNPMIVSMAAGLAWSSLHLPTPEPAARALSLLAAAATPGALFAIGASLAQLRLTRLGPACWLSTIKLVIHPAVVGLSAVWVFHIAPFEAGVMIAAAALPVAGNVYMLAQHYGVGAERVSAAIFVSTVVSIVTLPLILAHVTM
ncbi:AEC family transporter [Rhodobacteraceae bacterium]|nr:AEC family transporter [Paracoccaceae bacterium]